MSEKPIEEIQQSAVEKEFESTLWDQSFDLGIDVADNGLEAIVENELTKEIPVVKTLVAFYRIYSSFQARKNVKKVLAFFKSSDAGRPVSLKSKHLNKNFKKTIGSEPSSWKQFLIY